MHIFQSIQLMCCLSMVIVSFHFISIYTCSFEFIVMFYLIYVMLLFAGHNDVIPRSEKEGTKPLYVCPGCSNHTHGNNMINKCNVIK
jgi:hypothetical protein